MKSVYAFLVVASAVTPLAIAAPQGKSEREAMYRCRGIDGRMYVGSSTPQECVGRDTDVLDERGMIVRTIEGAATRAKRIAAEAKAAEQKKLEDEQKQRDKVLIETYLTVEDIERLRDQRLDLLTAQLKVAQTHIGTLQDRLDRLREQSARFKPYSDKPNAPPLPDHIAEDIVGTLKSIAADQQTIDIKRKEKESITTNFGRDIKRFKELKGIT